MRQSLIGNKPLTKSNRDLINVGNILADQYRKNNRPSQFVQKKTFSPSMIGGYSGSCFSAETEFVTADGIKTLGEMVGKTVTVLSAAGWAQATVQSFGLQHLNKITLMRSGVEKHIYATSDHRWIVEQDTQNKANRDKKAVVTTSELKTTDHLWDVPLKHSPKRTSISLDGFRAGFVFGDGNIDISNPRTGARLPLHGDKDLAYAGRFSDYKISQEFNYEGRNVPHRVVSGLPRRYKAPPPLDESVAYLYGWLSGYFAADGNVCDAVTLSSASMDNINLVKDVCWILGIKYSSVSKKIRVGINGKLLPIYDLTINPRYLTEDFFVHAHHLKNWKALVDKTPRRTRKWSVVSVEDSDRFEEVFCVVEPITETFALADDILTKNCPRYWTIAFNGAEFKYDTDPLSIAIMANGTAAHERLQSTLEEAGVLTEKEVGINLADPPVFGYVDALLDIDGEVVVGEFKTTNQEAFEFRKITNKPSEAHKLQLLLYLKATGNRRGLILYENRNSLQVIVIPVILDEDNEEWLEKSLDWMRRVYRAYQNNQKPKQPFQQRNKICQECPVFEACWKDKNFDIEIEKLDLKKL